MTTLNRYRSVGYNEPATGGDMGPVATVATCAGVSVANPCGLVRAWRLSGVRGRHVNGSPMNHPFPVAGLRIARDIGHRPA